MDKIKNFSFKEWFLRNKFYLLAFILPVFSMLLVLLFKGCIPFGDEVYIRSDCYHQYTPFLQLLREKLHNGGSLSYAWELGGGMNFAALTAYYTASPINLLTAIWPGSMAAITEFFIVFKIGLCGFSMTYFLSKRYKNESVLPIAFGMAYALSGYLAAYSWDIMWLDCIWVFPFIILGLERLVRERKCLMYAVALGYAILTNYYIGVMLCLFSIIYFIYLFAVTDVTPKYNKLEKRFLKKTEEDDATLSKVKARLLIFKDYCFYSLFAGGIAAAYLLPAYLNMFLTKSAESEFPTSLSQYFTTMYMLFRSMISIPIADLKYAHDPNIYASVAIFILVPLFWLCKKIQPKVRIGKTIIMALMLFSFSFNIPDYIWHGLHFPSSLPCRQSFMYIFLVLTMGYEAMTHIKTIKGRLVGISAGASIILFFIFEQFFDTTKLEIFTDVSINVSMYQIVWLSVIFVAAYAILIGLYKAKPHYKGFFSYLMILIVFLELTLNMEITSIQSTVSHNGYYTKYDITQALNKVAQKQSEQEGVKFYRTESKDHETRNDGVRYNYNSMSTFSSVALAGMQDFYTALGLQTSFNAYSYYGHTPLTAAMFSVKYEYAASEASLPNDMNKLDKNAYGVQMPTQNNVLDIFEYKNTLPLGFMINPSTTASWDLDGASPFENQNNFVKLAINNGKSIFHELEPGDTVGHFNASLLDSEEEMGTGTYDVYIYATTSAETLNVEVSGNSSNNLTFSSTNQNYICHVGNVNPGSKIKVTAGDDKGITACEAFAFDSKAWDEDFAALNSQGLKVTEFSDTDIVGTVEATTSGMLFTSLPYDKGWTAYVDGNEVKTEAICKKALTGINIEAGKHKIEFKYHAPGFLPGMIISALAVLILILLYKFQDILAFINKKKKQ